MSCEENDKENAPQRFQTPPFWALVQKPCLSCVIFYDHFLWPPLFTPSKHRLRGYFRALQRPWGEGRNVSKNAYLARKPSQKPRFGPFFNICHFFDRQEGPSRSKEDQKILKKRQKRGSWYMFFDSSQAWTRSSKCPCFWPLFYVFLRCENVTKKWSLTNLSHVFLPQKSKIDLFWPFFRWLSVRVTRLFKKQQVFYVFESHPHY